MWLRYDRFLVIEIVNKILFNGYKILDTRTRIQILELGNKILELGNKILELGYKILVLNTRY